MTNWYDLLLILAKHWETYVFWTRPSILIATQSRIGIAIEIMALEIL